MHFCCSKVKTFRVWTSSLLAQLISFLVFIIREKRKSAMCKEHCDNNAYQEKNSCSCRVNYRDGGSYNNILAGTDCAVSFLWPITSLEHLFRAYLCKCTHTSHQDGEIEKRSHRQDRYDGRISHVIDNRFIFPTEELAKEVIAGLGPSVFFPAELYEILCM